MSTRPSFRLSLEPLEARDTPSAMFGTRMTLLEVLQFTTVPGGTVNVTFADGRLTLTGDAESNLVHITQGPEGMLTISSDGSGTMFRLNGSPARKGVVLPAAVTGGVVINLNDGADGLVMEGVEVPGGLTILGGNGSADGVAGNAVRLRDVHVGGNLA